jgi:succinate dehydrogenase / fumarate reductase flavoprotein subunit
MSGYPETMQESLRLVEETRQRRIGKSFRMMSVTEKEETLRNWHPDYREGVKRVLRVGPCRGMLMTHEVADLLESYPAVKSREIDLSDITYDVDVLIIGAGGAGLSATLTALEFGIDREEILLVQKLRLGDANSKMSQGGIQAAVGSEDNPAIHFLDTIGGGHYFNEPNLVAALVKGGPEVIGWHESLGVLYDREADGFLQLSPMGGTSRNRMLSCKDYTGLEITRVLVDEFLNKGIPYVEFTSVVELTTDQEGAVTGAILFDMDTNEYFVARSKSTVLATGGSGRLHIQGFETTNHYGATGDGIAMAYHAGARLRDLDSSQFHPTGAAYPDQMVGQLCTEKLRGRGAQPLNMHGELFVHRLETRDVEASAIIRECYGRDNGVTTPIGMRGIWLDTPIIDMINGDGTIEREFASMLRNFNKFSIDIRKVPMLVFPTLHYQNGGVVINSRCETGVPGLYAAGEVCGGVHGKNRLAGNSQLDLYVFGRIAGRFAAKRAHKIKSGNLTLLHLDRYEKWLKDEGIKTEKRAPILLPEYRRKKTLERHIKLL